MIEILYIGNTATRFWQVLLKYQNNNPVIIIIHLMLHYADVLSALMNIFCD